jgi:hypothetical protein
MAGSQLSDSLSLEGEAGLVMKCSDRAAPSLYAVEGLRIVAVSWIVVPTARLPKPFFITDMAPSAERSSVPSQ